MPYVKLDQDILTSTLWFDFDARIVFITALLMAEPWETPEPVETLEVSGFKSGGFEVPPGWYGFVDAAGPAVVHRAGLGQEDGMAALHRLASPEPESRSKEFDGRRMVRVNGGYVILNWDKYRQKDHTTAERSRRYRAKLAELRAAKAESLALPNRYDPVTRGESHRDVTESHRDITQAEAEAYKENTGTNVPVRSLSGERPPERVPGIRLPKCPTQRLVDSFHERLPSLPRVEVLNSSRLSSLSARWRDVLTDKDIRVKDDPVRAAEDWFDWFWCYVSESDFLMGRAKAWRASFDWLIRPQNFVKVVEGNYHAKGK